MKKFLIGVGLAASALVANNGAHAAIPTEYYNNPVAHGNCTHQQIESQNSDQVVRVVDGFRCSTLYSEIQLLEVTLENQAFEKEIYLYDHSGLYEYNRSVKVRFVTKKDELEQGSGTALFLGKSENGHDRFLIRLVSVARPKPSLPVDVYVKMNGKQFQTTGVKLVP